MEDRLLVSVEDFGVWLGEIRQNVSVDALVTVIKKIEKWEKIKKAADEFHRLAIGFARLEAEAMIRIMELGGEDSLKKSRRKIAEWLYGLSEEEREKYIGMCAEEPGYTIGAIYIREHAEKVSGEIAVRAASDDKRCAVDEVFRTGYVHIKKYVDDIYEKYAEAHMKRVDAADVVDGMRGRLRAVGAVGNGEYEYFLPEKGLTKENVQAIGIRINGIINNFKSLVGVIKVIGAPENELGGCVYYRGKNDADGVKIEDMLSEALGLASVIGKYAGINGFSDERFGVFEDVVVSAENIEELCEALGRAKKEVA